VRIDTELVLASLDGILLKLGVHAQLSAAQLSELHAVVAVAISEQERKANDAGAQSPSRSGFSGQALAQQHAMQQSAARAEAELGLVVCCELAEHERAAAADAHVLQFELTRVDSEVSAVWRRANAFESLIDDAPTRYDFNELVDSGEAAAADHRAALATLAAALRDADLSMGRHGRALRAAHERRMLSPSPVVMRAPILPSRQTFSMRIVNPSLCAQIASSLPADGLEPRWSSAAAPLALKPREDARGAAAPRISAPPDELELPLAPERSSAGMTRDTSPALPLSPTPALLPLPPSPACARPSTANPTRARTTHDAQPGVSVLRRFEFVLPKEAVLRVSQERRHRNSTHAAASPRAGGAVGATAEPGAAPPSHDGASPPSGGVPAIGSGSFEHFVSRRRALSPRAGCALSPRQQLAAERGADGAGAERGAAEGGPVVRRESPPLLLLIEADPVSCLLLARRLHTWLACTVEPARSFDEAEAMLARGLPADCILYSLR
jgi:hypothetical protein